MKDIKLFVKGVFFCLCFLAISYIAHAQEGYDITLDIGGLGEEPVVLGNFFGESTYIVDSSEVVDGKQILKGAEPLATGMYFIAKSKQRVFDLVIGDDQNFTIQSNASDIIDAMTVTGDADNALFIKDMKFNKSMNSEAAPYLEILKDSTAAADTKAEARTGLNSINEKVQQHREQIIQDHPGSFLALFYRAQREEMPDENSSRKEIEQLKKNFWNDFDLADPTLLRLNIPLYREKVDEYLDSWVNQNPDSLKVEIDKLARVASGNQDTYKYMIWMLTLKYQNPRIMGQDALFVHIYDNYFASGEMDYWANEQLKSNVGDYANQIRNSLVGKKAPNMIMLDSNLQARSLYDIPNRFTVIYFFDPDCHHCKLATPVLDKLYESNKYDMEVYAVSTDTSMAKMNTYIQDMGLTWQTVNGPRTATEPYYKMYDAMTTPTIYILNEKKIIIAKKLPVDRIDDFLQNYIARNEE